MIQHIVTLPGRRRVELVLQRYIFEVNAFSRMDRGQGYTVWAPQYCNLEITTCTDGKALPERSGWTCMYQACCFSTGGPQLQINTFPQS